MKAQLRKLLHRLISQEKNLESVLANPDTNSRNDILRFGIGQNAKDARELLEARKRD